MSVSNETVTSTAIKTTNTNNEDDEIVTSVTLVLPSSRTSSTQFTSSTASVTMNVPAVMSSSTQQQQQQQPTTLSNATKKTDLDLISIKVSPTKLNATADGSSSGGGGGNTKDSLYGMGITDDDKNGKAAIHKRSLLDIDNASSLSLADKLRNEANKYSDENAGRENFGTNKEARCEQIDKKTGTPTTPTSPNGGLYQSSGVASSTSSSSSSSSSITNVSVNAAPATTSTITTTTTSLNSNANERRPSWRLKLDAGCKVKTKHTKKKTNKTKNIPKKCRPNISTCIKIRLVCFACIPTRTHFVLLILFFTTKRDPVFYAIKHIHKYTQFNTMKNATRLFHFESNNNKSTHTHTRKLYSRCSLPILFSTKISKKIFFCALI